MYLVVRNFLAANSALTATLPAFAAGVTRFNSELSQLQALALGSDAETKGLTADKATKKETMARLTGDISSLLRAYAMAEATMAQKIPTTINSGASADWISSRSTSPMIPPRTRRSSTGRTPC